MKLIHFLWDDNTEPVKRFDDSARKMNSGADVILWRFGEVKKLMVGALAHLSPIYNSMPFLLQRANLLRLVLVEQFGGIYLDMDMECLKPLDDLFERDLLFGFVNSRVISNALLGAADPHHPLWHAMFARIAAMDQRIHRDTVAIKTTGAELFTGVVKQQGCEHHALSARELYSKQGYTFHHAGRPAWVGKQFIGGELHENRSEYAIA